ncbi:MAG: mechanosensitive ion channel family protein [Deltaproteobacteria bacterium]|nr:mechanosensitive ion channel family protein [Deltaproteobacteria bacterium]
MPILAFPDLSPAARVVLVFFCALLGLLFLRAVAFRWLRRLAARTQSQVDDLAIDALRLPSLFWAAALSIEAALQRSELPEELRAFFGQAVTAIVILSITIVAANTLAAVLNARLRTSGQAAASGIARTLARGVVLLLGLTMVLHQLGVAVGPLLTALGVGGLAVALALQDTLGNFFAGIHILLERPFAIGHFVKLEGGEEGWVQDIGWRTTRILTLNEHTVVVPNSKIAGSTIVNMALPDPVVRAEILLGLAYGTDLPRAIALLQDELEVASRELPQLVPDPRPDVLFDGFGDWSLNLVLRFHLKQVALERVAASLVRARVYERVRREGLEIPFPVQVVHLSRDGGGA